MVALLIFVHPCTNKAKDSGYNKTVISILAKPTLTKIKIVMQKSNKRSPIVKIGQILAIDRKTRV